MKDVSEGNTARALETPFFDSHTAHSIIKEVLETIGDCDQLTLPTGIKPHLVALTEASTIAFYAEHEDAYWELYGETAELCRQGWRSFNYWISLEQMTCYKLYWEMKRIADKFDKPLAIPRIVREQSKMEAFNEKLMGFVKKIAKFLHFHELEYYRSIVSEQEKKDDSTH